VGRGTAMATEYRISILRRGKNQEKPLSERTQTCMTSGRWHHPAGTLRTADKNLTPVILATKEERS
jgi:hypothetical protein